MTLPTWAAQLRDRYVAGESSLFVLHGSVRDLQPWTADDGTTTWVDLPTFLQRFLARRRDVVASFDVSRGLRFADKAHERLARRVVDARRMLDGLPPLGDLPRTVTDALPVIEALITDGARSSGVVLDYAEMVAPQADPAFLSADDKANLVTLRRWSSDPAVLGTDNLVVLVTESLAALARSVIASPQLAVIAIPFPDEATRRAFVDAQLGSTPTAMSPDALAKVTAGLTLLQVRALLQMARQTGRPIDFATVNARKKAVIEQECFGLVEFVAPAHGLEHVGGVAEIVRDLRRVAEDVKAGHTNRVPMGMIFVGPMGTGKTYVAEAFAAASGLTCLKFKNFRDRWVGSTEQNLEKVLELVEALGYVLLIIDEAERALASGDGDSGVGSRVIARLKEFLSDTSHRGRIVVLMMTNRPDKLDADLKRPGRFDLKVPFFYPETVDERLAVLGALVRKSRFVLAEGVELRAVAEAAQGYSAAELEAVLLAAATLASTRGTGAAADDQPAIGADDLDAAVRDTLPSRDLPMLAYMEMLAVFECSARRMLPERYRELSTDEVLRRLDALKLTLGRRAL
jgi:AAA+ superfamily predicted ATPase